MFQRAVASQAKSSGCHRLASTETLGPRMAIVLSQHLSAVLPTEITCALPLCIDPNGQSKHMPLRSRTKMIRIQAKKKKAYRLLAPSKPTPLRRSSLHLLRPGIQRSQHSADNRRKPQKLQSQILPNRRQRLRLHHHHRRHSRPRRPRSVHPRTTLCVMRSSVAASRLQGSNGVKPTMNRPLFRTHLPPPPTPVRNPSLCRENVLASNILPCESLAHCLPASQHWPQLHHPLQTYLELFRIRVAI